MPGSPNPGVTSASAAAGPRRRAPRRAGGPDCWGSVRTGAKRARRSRARRDLVVVLVVLGRRARGAVLDVRQSTPVVAGRRSHRRHPPERGEEHQGAGGRQGVAAGDGRQLVDGDRRQVGQRVVLVNGPVAVEPRAPAELAAAASALDEREAPAGLGEEHGRKVERAQQRRERLLVRGWALHARRRRRGRRRNRPAASACSSAGVGAPRAAAQARPPPESPQAARCRGRSPPGSTARHPRPRRAGGRHLASRGPRAGAGDLPRPSAGRRRRHARAASARLAGLPRRSAAAGRSAVPSSGRSPRGRRRAAASAT